MESGRGLQVLGRAAQALSRQQGPSLQFVRLDDLPAAAAESPDPGRMEGAGTLRWVWQAARCRIQKANGRVGMRSRAVLSRGPAATAQGGESPPGSLIDDTLAPLAARCIFRPPQELFERRIVVSSRGKPRLALPWSAWRGGVREEATTRHRIPAPAASYLDGDLWAGRRSERCSPQSGQGTRFVRNWGVGRPLRD